MKRVKCRLLYIVGGLDAGGLERQLYTLLESLDRTRYRPSIAVWNFCEEDPYVAPIRALGVPFFPLPSSSRLAKLLAIRRIVKQLRPEVIHSYSFYTNVAAFWSSIGTDSIAIGSVRCDFAVDKGECGWLLGRLSAYWPRYQIFNSFAAAKHAQCSNSFFRPKKSLVVRNGLNLNQFSPLPVNGMKKALIVGVGSLSSRKRWDRLLSAAVSLKQNGFDFSVQIAGDGPLRKSLMQCAQDLGIADYIEFTGLMEDIGSLLAEATFLVHPSDAEGCPNAVMEAMACGRAVVATDVGDIPDLIEDGKTGFVVPCDDAEKLKSRIETLITDRELGRRMGKAGRAKAEGEFGLDRFVSETLLAYQSIGWAE